MLFVLGARREAPMKLITVNSRGVPVWAILASTVVGFLSVIAAYVSPDTVFLFLLNSSGAVILFVYLLIAVSQFVLRRRADDSQLTVKMWLFPWLTLLAAVGIVAVLVQMAFSSDTRSQLLLSLLSFAVVLVLYAVTRWRGGSVSTEDLESLGGGRGGGSREQEPARRVLVLANRTLTGEELHDALEALPGSDSAAYHVVVPANPVDTGQADREGAAFVWEATTEAAQQRLDQTLTMLRERGLTVEGELGDYRPLVALEHAMQRFEADHVVISTQPDDQSTWLRHDVVARAKQRLSVPVHHVVVHEAEPTR
jgi:GABA permease